MARLEKIIGDRYIWNLEKCEETAVAGAYVIVSPRISASWLHDLEVKFFSQGFALADKHLRSLNRNLRQCGLDEIEIRETDVSDYARRWSDHDAKISYREEQRHRFTKAAANDRPVMLRKAMDEMGRLLMSHMTQSEYESIYGPKGRRREARLLEVERSRRIAALEAAVKDSQPMNHTASKPVLTYDQAALLLKNTGNPELIGRIVDRLDTDAYLQLVAAEHVPQAIKDLVIDRILAA